MRRTRVDDVAPGIDEAVRGDGHRTVYLHDGAKGVHAVRLGRTDVEARHSAKGQVSADGKSVYNVPAVDVDVDCAPLRLAAADFKAGILPSKRKIAGDRDHSPRVREANMPIVERKVAVVDVWRDARNLSGEPVSEKLVDDLAVGESQRAYVGLGATYVSLSVGAKLADRAQSVDATRLLYSAVVLPCGGSDLHAVHGRRLLGVYIIVDGDASAPAAVPGECRPGRDIASAAIRGYHAGTRYLATDDVDAAARRRLGKGTTPRAPGLTAVSGRILPIGGNRAVDRHHARCLDAQHAAATRSTAAVSAGVVRRTA